MSQEQWRCPVSVYGRIEVKGWMKMSNYVNVNTECQTSEPRQNVGIGNHKNQYEFTIWYRNHKDKLKSLQIFGNMLQVRSRQDERLIGRTELLEITEISTTKP